MNNQDQTPFEQTAEAPVTGTVETPVGEETVETKDVNLPIDEPENVEETNRRTVYNCPTCKGSGLVKDSRSVDVLCSQCNGTGKV